MNVRWFFTAALALLFLGWSAAHAEQYIIPLFLAPGTSGDPQGVLRIVNDTGDAATVQVFAIADDGTRAGPATIALGASAAAEFDATELRSANAAKGLSGGLGRLSGDVRLSIDSDALIVPLAFVRSSDGALSAMHDTVRPALAEGEPYRYEIPVFNPSTDVTRASRLRLINPGAMSAAVTIAGRDDGGAVAGGGDVTLTLPAGGARTLTARQLEAGGAGLTGRLGAATGGWRLAVTSDRPLEVVNIVASSTGHWNNLSTTAVRGAAPADLAGFNDRFVGQAAVLEVEGGRRSVAIMSNGRCSETVQVDGLVATSECGYDYVGLGPDAGQLTLDYDDGSRCRANLYFSSRMGGWFASRCTGAAGSVDTRSGGNWFVEDGEDDSGGGGPVETTYAADDALPGFDPGSDFFSVTSSVGGGVSVSSGGGGWTATMDDGGWIQMRDGTRYTCASAGGCGIVDGTVTRGSVTGRTQGSGEVDRFPSFRSATAPGNQTYTVGTAIAALRLPEASGGNGALAYDLSPNVPGLTFNAATRQLSGTPSTAASYNMTYTVTDEDGDTDTLMFAITVSADTPTDGSLGVCRVGMTLSSGQSCSYPGTADEFSINARGRGSFLDRLAGIRIRLNNETVNGRVYDFEAWHQGGGVWRIDRIAGGTDATGTPPMTGGGGMVPEDSSPSFAADAGVGNQRYTVGTTIDALTLPEASGGDGTLTYSLSPDVPGLSFSASTRQLTGTPTTAGTHAMTYTATDEDGDTDTLGFTITVARRGTVFIPDTRLRTAIATALGKASDAPITHAEMASLTYLEAIEAGISNLNGLQSATNLSRLLIWENRITDISPLANLTNLSRLVIWGNRITDISPLASLTNLTVLSLDYNNVTDISPLAGLTNLRELSLSDTDISDFSVLSDLPSLTHLRLIALNIANVSPLSNLTKLTTLVLSHNQITDITPLSGLTNLTDLNFWDNRIEDISALSGLTNLTVLGLGLNNVMDISALEGLNDLTELTLNDNNISDISPLAGLTNLTGLSLAFNNVTDISALAGLTGLMDLNLAGNRITDTTALSGLTNLRNLDLRANPLNDLPKGDFDIELVFLDDFTESQQQVLDYVARRWMAVIVEDLQEFEFSGGWTGTCAGQSFQIAPGERIDDLRVYVGTIDPNVGILGHGGPLLLREETHLPVLGCMAFDLSHANLLITGLHEIGHVLGFASEVWNEFGFFQNPPNGDTHFSGPLTIAAFDDAGGRDYTGAKVPLHTGESHWRIPDLEGELMAPYGGGTLSAITVQSLADLGYGVDVTQADAYALPGAAAARVSGNITALIPEDDPLMGELGEAEPVGVRGFGLGDGSLSGRLALASQTPPALSCGIDLRTEPIQVVDSQGRVTRIMGN